MYFSAHRNWISAVGGVVFANKQRRKIAIYPANKRLSLARISKTHRIIIICFGEVERNNFIKESNYGFKLRKEIFREEETTDNEIPWNLLSYDSMDALIKCGAMIKRSQNKKKWSIVNYKNRWFELSRSFLVYYDQCEGGREVRVIYYFLLFQLYA